MKILFPLFLLFVETLSTPESDEKDGDSSRKILGSSVVTSVSVIMDTGNGTQIIDAVGKPVPKPHGPSPVASPINLLNPDRYEFFTFNDNGELVKRLMTLEEIQGIIANGDGEDVNYNVAEYLPEKKVNDIVSNVQNVLKEQMVNHKYAAISKPILDTPDVSNTWSMILPAFFGNTGEEITPDKTQSAVTADTLMITDDISTKIKEFEKLTTPLYASSSSSTKPSPPQNLTTVPLISSVMQLLKTTPALTTSTTTSSLSTSTELPVIHYIKLTTEQHIENTKTTTTETPATKLQEQSSDTPLITVAIISDTKYNTSNLEGTSKLPLVSILPVKDILDERPTTVEIKLTQPEVVATPSVEEKLRISTKPTETVNMYSTTPTTPVTTSSSQTTNIPTISTRINTTNSNIIETTTKANEIEKGTFTIDTTQVTSTSSKRATISSQIQATTKLPDTTLGSITNPIREATTLKGTPSSLITNEPTEMKIITTQEHIPSTLQESFSPTTTTTSKPTENDSFTTWSSVKSDIPPRSTSPLTTSKTEDSSQSALTKIPVLTLSTTEKLKEIVKDEIIPNAGINSLSALKSTTPIWIIIKRKTEIPEQKIKNEQQKVKDNQQKVENQPLKIEKQNQKDQSVNYQQVETINTKTTNNLNNQNYKDEQSSNQYKEESIQDVQKISSTHKIEVTQPITEIPTTLAIELKNMPLYAHSPLTSTKIYEINTKLSSKLPETTSEALYIPETESNDSSEKYTNQETTTQTLEETTYTTQPSLIQSIQQLLLQTVNDVEEPIINVDANVKIGDMLANMNGKPMQDLQNEVATIGSSIETKLDNSNASDVTDLPTTVSADEIEFSEAVSSVLSQIYALDGATTIEDFVTTQEEGETSTIPMDKLHFETTTSKIANEETQTPLEIPQTPKEENTTPKDETLSPKLPAKSDLTTEVQLMELKGDFESKKNISKEVIETSPIPYGEKLTTREVVTPTTLKIPENVEVISDKHNNSWTLVSTILPPSSPSTQPLKPSSTTPAPIKLPNQPFHGFGLEETTSRLDTDVYQFVELCNELSFGFWNAVTNGISSVRSVFVSPFAATSLLAMVFLGARGATSGEMNEILKLDDMVTFNPHLIFKNVSESIEAGKGNGVAISVIARELYSDRSKGKLLNFYKERAKQFYDGFVEEVNFKEIGDVVRRRTNLIVKKNSGGKIQEYLKDSTITLRPPLAGVSASIFETDCTQASTEGRDGELHFVVLPSIRQRKLVPIPAAVYRSGFLAGYDPQLDATAASIGGPDQVISTIFVIPGQQGIAAPGDGLLRLERQLAETAFKKGSWGRLLRSLIPRPGLELQIPRFMHKSIINSTVALQKMGLKDLFSFDKADLRGLNGQAHELHLSDVLQLNTFATCGENMIGEDHHMEIYPATSRRPSRRSRKLGFYLPESVFAMERIGDDEPRDYQRSFDDPLHDPDLLALPLPLRPRQARLPDAPRLRFDRPFLFFVRHNPTGLILHMGRFNPRLLP